MIESNMTFDNQNKPKGVKRLRLALGNSLRAIHWLMMNESAFKQEVWLLFTTLVVLPFLPFSLYENLFIVAATLFVMFAEIINTAIETTLDRISLDINPLTGLAKDLASAGVTLSLVVLGLVWAAVLYNHFM